MTRWQKALAEWLGILTGIAIVAAAFVLFLRYIVPDSVPQLTASGREILATDWAQRLLNFENYKQAEVLSNTLDLFAFVLVTPEFLAKDTRQKLLDFLQPFVLRVIGVNRVKSGKPSYYEWAVIVAVVYFIPFYIIVPWWLGVDLHNNPWDLLFFAPGIPLILMLVMAIPTTLVMWGMNFWFGAAMFVAARGVMIFHAVTEVGHQ